MIWQELSRSWGMILHHIFFTFKNCKILTNFYRTTFNERLKNVEKCSTHISTYSLFILTYCFIMTYDKHLNNYSLTKLTYYKSTWLSSLLLLRLFIFTSWLTKSSYVSRVNVCKSMDLDSRHDIVCGYIYINIWIFPKNHFIA